MRKGKQRAEEAGEEVEEEDFDRPFKRQRRRVPALAEVVVKALLHFDLERKFSWLEPFVRRVVSEEVERALANLASSNNGPRHLTQPQTERQHNGRSLQLRFSTTTSATLTQKMYTGQNIAGPNGAPFHILLVDANTNSLVSSGPEASARLNVLVLDGDFNYEDADDWSEEQFMEHEVKKREGKGPLLVGDLQVSLKKGVGTLGELRFTDNSRWTRSRKFKLAVKVAAGCCSGTRIREAVTPGIVVKEVRGKPYEKRYPPALEDEVWRLEHIAKTGPCYEKLKRINVHRVRDFLKYLLNDPQGLRDILGSSMTEKNWEKLVRHARTASLNGKHYICYSNDSKNTGAIFDVQRVFIGLIEGDRFIPSDHLNDARWLDLADALMEKAYRNWLEVAVYEGEDLLEFIKSDRATTASSSSCPFHLQTPVSEANGIAGHDANRIASLLDPPPACSDTHFLNQITLSNVAPPIQNDDADGYGPEQQQQQHAKPGLIAGNLASLPEYETEFSPRIENVNVEHQQPNDDWWENLSDEIGIILGQEEMQAVLSELSGNKGRSCAESDFVPLVLKGERDPSTAPPTTTTTRRRRASAGWVKITRITAIIRWAVFTRRSAADKRRRAELDELQD